jgi:hypothetical protein
MESKMSVPSSAFTIGLRLTCARCKRVLVGRALETADGSAALFLLSMYSVEDEDSDAVTEDFYRLLCALGILCQFLR